MVLLDLLRDFSIKLVCLWVFKECYNAIGSKKIKYKLYSISGSWEIPALLI